MTYSDLQQIADKKRFKMKDICDAIDMSYPGLQKSFENQTFPIKKVLKLCELLEITPNEFFSVGSIVNQRVSTNNGSIVGIDNRQYYSDSPDVLRAQVELLEERIKEKDSQIKEKDSQIKELLKILANRS